MIEIKTNEELFNFIKDEYYKSNNNLLNVKLANLHTIKGNRCNNASLCEPISDVNPVEECIYGSFKEKCLFDTSIKEINVEFDKLDLSSLNIDTHKNFLKEKEKDIYFILNEIYKVSNGIGKFYFEKYENIDSMISKTLEKKKENVNKKKRRYMQKYSNIEELSNDIDNNKKKIEYYLNILKYLIPMLIILIFIKIFI